MRVDAHHHVGHRDRGDYGWLKPTAALLPICRDFDLDELAPLVRSAGIGATVLVQAAPTMAETRFLLEVAHRSADLVRGVVGWVDLAGDDAIAQLSSLTSDPLLKSVRPMLQDLSDPAWIARSEVQPALAVLPGLDLRFDALVSSRELAPLRSMLERHPDLAVVIDHCAKPDVARGAWQPWAELLATIARDTGAYCKLSGLLTEAGPVWSVDALRPYVAHVLDSFGTERVIWGSDWPVLTLAASYAEWTAASDALLAGLTRAERDAIYGDNARRFYGLG
jgi:L-fuconolactonase